MRACRLDIVPRRDLTFGKQTITLAEFIAQRLGNLVDSFFERIAPCREGIFLLHRDVDLRVQQWLHPA